MSNANLALLCLLLIEMACAVVLWWAMGIDLGNSLAQKMISRSRKTRLPITRSAEKGPGDE